MSRKAKIKTKSTKKNGCACTKFLICFRRAVVDNTSMQDVDVDSVRLVRGSSTDGPREPLSKYVAMAEKEGVVFPRMLPAAAAAAAASSSENDDNEENTNNNNKDENDVQTKQTKKKKKYCSWPRLLGLLKAVLFETSVAKKIEKRKLKQKMSKSNENENSLHDKEKPQLEDGKIPSNASSSSRSSSLFTSSSASSSSLSSNSRLSSDRNFKNKFERKQKQEKSVRVHGKGWYGLNSGLCLLFISLLVLVIWGKVCAILCTSAWFFIVPRWKIGKNSPENVVCDSLKLDSEDEKSSWKN